MTKTAPKWGSVRPRKTVHNWTFWAQGHMIFMLKTYTRVTLSIDSFNETLLHYTNISVAPFGPNLWPTAPEIYDQMAPKWGSVRPRTMVHNWTVWAQVHMILKLEAGKRLTLSFDNLNETLWHCINISGAPFGPRSMTQTAPKWGSVRLRKTVHNWIFDTCILCSRQKNG